MPDSARLDATRLHAELFFVHQTLSRIDISSTSLLEDLHDEAASSSVLIWRALFSDCLRVAYSVAIADGVIYDFELERMAGLVSLAAKHYTGARDAPYGDRPPIDVASTRTFLDHYGHDVGPFGYRAAVPWRGHVLCQRAATAGHAEPLYRYARLMWWLIDEACKISDVTLANPRWSAALSEISQLRLALTSAGLGPTVEIDTRRQAFLSHEHVFTPVEDAASVREADPFDVDVLHKEARTSFQRLVKQATSRSTHIANGRTLLLLGGSGAGKTHLLRSFWSYVQEYGRGFVAYSQLYANADDYTRYLLHSIVESLKEPYAGAPGGRTGLGELALRIARLKGPDFATRTERLGELNCASRSVLDRQVNELLDELLEHPALAGFAPDLLRVMLYALCRDPKTTARVHQYLRCDGMNDHDRSLLGDVAARTASADPKAMIRELAQLAYAAGGAILVLMVDQAELSGVDSAQAMVAFQGAIDALLGIASEVPSVVVVIACLSDLYDKARALISSPTRDRLENDPPPAGISNHLSYDEIEAVVGRRLALVFAESGAPYRASEPVYPIPEAQLRRLVNRRPRDVLNWCQRFHERCVKDGKIEDSEGPAPAEPPPIERIDAAWRAAYQAARVTAQPSEDDVLALVTIAAQAFATETGVPLTSSKRKDNLLRIQFSSGAQAELVIAVTNRGPQAGAFGIQIRKLRQAARGGVAVALRTEEFPRGAKSVEAVAELTGAGGRVSCLDKATLRALIAYQSFQPPFTGAHLEAWKRLARPISSLSPISEMFGLEDQGTAGGKRDSSSRAS